jgi:hypothetical protein
MKAVTIIVLLSFNLATSQELHSVDQLTDDFLDRATSSPNNLADLDETTLGKAASGSALGSSTMGTRGAAAAPSLASRFPAGPRPQLQTNAIPMLGSSVHSAPAFSMSAVTSGRPLVVTPQAAMTTLSAFGAKPHPFEKLALTAIAATRDVSMKAQVRQEIENLDDESRGKLQSLSNAVVVRAMALQKEKMAGITEPMGFWDPLGISANFDDKTLYLFREAELKHGRFGMMASLGIVVAEKFHPFFSDIPFESAVQVHIEQGMIDRFWPAALALIGIHELFILPQDLDRMPGDLQFDPLGLKPKDEKERVDMQNKELNNGRLAMLAATGMIAEECLFGKLSI